LPDYVLDGAVAFSELDTRLHLRAKNQIRMSEGVVAKSVPGFGNGTGDLRTLLYVAADHEECRPDIMPSQHLQKPQRVRVIGSIVKGEGQVPGV
jgi:hypothetical protein